VKCLDVTGAENADAVDYKNGSLTALKPSLFRAWQWISSDPDTEAEKWRKKGDLAAFWSRRQTRRCLLQHRKRRRLLTPFVILMEEIDFSRTMTEHDLGYAYKFASVAVAWMFVVANLCRLIWLLVRNRNQIESSSAVSS